MADKESFPFLGVPLEIRLEDGKVISIRKGDPHVEAECTETSVSRLHQELLEYAAGKRKSFDVPFCLKAPDRETRVYQAILNIPYGKTSSYTALAAAAGFPGAVRWTASICAKNPLPLLIPCHRVLRKDGRSGGYNLGAGLKEDLLRLEKEYSKS